MKRFIKKITAAGAGGLMLMSVLGGAFAAGETLASLPAPFVVSDKYVSTAMVVGSVAGLNDDNARSTLKTYFDGFATGTAAGLGDQIQTEEVKLQTNIATSTGLETVYDDADSDIFFDDEISIGGTSYDYHTELQVNSTTDRFDVETSTTSQDDKYETDPKLEIRKDSLKYCYVFDENIQLNKTVSTTNPFDMKFLGKTLRIDTINNATKFTAQVGDTWVGHPGETYTGNGITMEVVTIDATSAIVDFGDDQRTLSEGSTISKGEIDIYLDSAVAGVGTLEEAVAKFVIGEDARTGYSDGEKFSIYCSPSDGHGDPDCDKDNPDWIWDIKGLETETSGSTNSICVENDFEAYNANKNPAGVGEYYGLPNGFAYLGIDDLTVADDKYMTVTITTDTGNIEDLSNAGNFPSSAVVLTIEADQTEGLTVKQSSLNESVITADTKTEEIYLYQNSTMRADGASTWSNKTAVFYKGTDNKIKYAGNVTVAGNVTGAPPAGVGGSEVTFGYINYDNTKSTDIELRLFGNQTHDNGVYLGFVPDSSLSSNDNLWFRIDSDVDTNQQSGGVYQGFGSQDNDESTEVIWGQTSTAAGNFLTSNTTSNSMVHLGGKKYDLRTGYGVILEDTDVGGDGDQFTLKMPADQVKANVAVYEGGAATAMEPVLVTESGAAGYTNLLLVGGPCVNSLTAEYMGLTYPSCGSASTIAPDTAVIKLVEKTGKSALIVAGWEMADTQRAATSVAAGGLTGTEQLV